MNLRGALEKAEEKGRSRELRRSLADLCELLDIELTAERQALLAAADLAQLETLRERIKRERGWPLESISRLWSRDR